MTCPAHLKRLLPSFFCLLALSLPLPAQQPLRSLAESGHADAQYELALWYLDAENPRADESWAITWLRKAAIQGHESAREKLESIYQQHGVSLDQHPLPAATTPQPTAAPAEPASDTPPAAENGLAAVAEPIEQTAVTTEVIPAEPPVAVMMDPYNAPTNASTALPATGEVLDSQDVMLEMAAGMDAHARDDYLLSASIFSRLAHQGHAYAQYRLGLQYLAGEGMDQNTEKGRYWLQIAASQGHQRSAEKLSTLPPEQAEASPEPTPESGAEQQDPAPVVELGSADEPAAVEVRDNVSGSRQPAGSDEEEPEPAPVEDRSATTEGANPRGHPAR